MPTEDQNPRSAHLDQMDTLTMLRVMNDEDQQVALAVRDALPQIAHAVEMIQARLAAGGRLFYIGAGTSGRLGVLDAVECVPTFGTLPERVQGIIAGGNDALVQSVEGAEDDPQQGATDLDVRQLTDSDVVVGIAASGRTPYVLGAIAHACDLGAGTVGLACNDPSPLLDAAEIAIGVIVGAEILTGSTRLKAGTAQKMVLNMLSTATFVQLGKVYGNWMVDVQITNAKLADRARRIIQEITDTDASTAADLLAAADNNVKVAIVMHAHDVSATTARALLADTDGHLRPVLESSSQPPEINP